jgi:tetratricopeptide (TPR) repeat protein
MKRERIFVGREQELATFRAMVDREIEPWVLALAGPGGIGKTWLLQEFVSLAAQQNAPHSGLIDLYYTDLQTETGLLRAIGTHIGLEHFPGLLEALRESGKGPASVRAEKLADAVREFIRGLEALTAEGRVVILFDTFEKISGTHVATWFLGTVLPQMSEHVILVCAGRNDFLLADGSRGAQGSPSFGETVLPLPASEVRLLSLGAFAPEDVHQYLKEYLKQREEGAIPLQVDPGRYEDLKEPPSEIHVIWEKSRGHPVIVALTADWLAEWGTGMVADVADLSPEDFTRELVSKVRELETPEDEAIVRMAHVHHRFNARILEATYPDLPAKGLDPRAVIQTLRRFSFVKYWPETGTCLLHDEMQRLIERYVLDEIDKTKDLRREISAEMVEYYDGALAQEPDERRRWVLEAERMYHHLYSGARGAYADFWHKLDEAWDTYRLDLMRMVQTKGEEANTRLHDPTLEVLCLAARTWVSLEEWDLERVHDLAQRVLAHPAGVQTTRATALTVLSIYAERTGAVEDALETYHEALRIYQHLEERLEREETLADEHHIPTLPYVRNEIAKLYNHIGIVHRKNGQLDEAIEYYNRARDIAVQAENLEWWAASLNNIGNVDRLQGQLETALRLCRQALKLRRTLQARHPGLAYQRDIALSHNTLGMVLRDMQQHDDAQEHFEQAERMFERLHDRSGLARSIRNQGWVCFLKGKHAETEQESRKHFREALQHYGRSHKICVAFHIESELPNLLNKIGIAERALGHTEAAQRAFTRSLDLAYEHNDNLFIVHDLVRLAEMAYQAGDLERMRAYVETVEQFKARGLRFGLAYAEMEELLADVALDREQYATAFQHLGRSFAYLARLNRWRFDRKLPVLHEFFEALPNKIAQRQYGAQLKEYWVAQGLGDTHADLTVICEEYIMTMQKEE